MENENFIGVYRNAFPSEYCSFLIEEFERLQAQGAGSSRLKQGDLKHARDDYFMHLNLVGQSVSSFEGETATGLFFKGLQMYFTDYMSRYSVLNDVTLTSTHMKMQKTVPSGGYHLWHGEQGNGEASNRILTYILYLNSLPAGEGGETEFLYQRLRIPPEEGTLVIWPAAFTHAHRGNTVLGNTPKYIVTGWFNLE